MNVFEEVKRYVTTRQVTENYGTKVNRSGMACCPFHKDKHPSMKVDNSHYHCFGCGAHGDAIGYVAQLFGLSQYDAACKIIEDFGLSVVTNKSVSEEEKKVYRDNCMVIMQYDPVLSGAICHNDLTCKMDIIKNLGWGKPHGGGIRDVDVNQIEWYLERTYEIKNYKAIGKAMNIIASQNHFHPIKEYLEQLEWDGVSRIAEVLPKYLGADKCEYTTEVMTS